MAEDRMTLIDFMENRIKQATKENTSVSLTVEQAVEIVEGQKKHTERMDKMRIENAELFQHIHRLEEELGKERAYLKALVTIINNADFTHT